MEASCLFIENVRKVMQLYQINPGDDLEMTSEVLPSLRVNDSMTMNF